MAQQGVGIDSGDGQGPVVSEIIEVSESVPIQVESSEVVTETTTATRIVE